MEIVKIGNNIKKLRELKNYTQEYMASQLEMSQGGYGKIERGETDISLSKIDAIAKILGVNVSMILDFDDKIFFNINQNSNEQVETLAGVIFENKSFESEKALS